MASLRPSSIALMSGIISAKPNNVTRTAMWATTLFCVLIPLFKRTKIIPIITGISEVGDPDSK